MPPLDRDVACLWDMREAALLWFIVMNNLEDLISHLDHLIPPTVE